MSNRIIEFHDSTIESIVHDASAVTLIFTEAYIHMSDGRAGIDPGTGWIQKAELIIGNGSISGDQRSLPAVLSDGTIIIGNRKHSNFIPIPLDTSESVSVDLEFFDGNRISIIGRTARLMLIGEPKYVEDFNP